jgi:hypothetical protein
MDCKKNKYMLFIKFFMLSLIIYVLISTILFIVFGKSELIDSILMFFWIVYVMVLFRRINSEKR